ncbi:hypothetical protein HPC49_38865 [Pyxidicoccus fallax]|uniref:Lipoprotein n=1 Tax=Pyxidicoccus fallax TaxID=394095 RepID=A0A848LH36_9BACT|nr:hypothetical protein [Pyxidicoccus fallax]NMO16925.1 hypothetical protein [Pyxidicoccus fallax]NPC84161.1 hypothetical protein [Pyxidicoccus fallax]
MQVFKRAVWLSAVLSLSACGGPEEVTPREDADALVGRTQTLTTGTSQGCTFTISYTTLSLAPPYYRVDLKRAASETCPWPEATTTLLHGYSVPTLSLAANDLGVATGVTRQQSPSVKYGKRCNVRHTAPDTLDVVRDTEIMVAYGSSGVIQSCNLSIASDGTTLTVTGSKTGPLPGETGTGSSRYVATFPDFFTSTTPPTYSSF